MRDQSAIKEDILRIEEIVKEYKYKTTGQIGISEIGYGLIEKIGTEYHKAFEKECPDTGSKMTKEEVSAFFGKKNVKRDTYGNPIQVKGPFFPLFQITPYGRTFDSLVKFCDGTGDKLSKSAAELNSCIERLEGDIESALSSIDDCFQNGEKATEAEKVAAKYAIEVMAVLKEHNLADYGTCEYNSVEDLLEKAKIAADIERKADEKREKQAAELQKKLKEFSKSPRENFDQEVIEKIGNMVKEAQYKGIDMARITRIFEMEHPSSKAYGQMGGRTSVFKEMHTLLYTTLRNINALYKKIEKRKSEPKPQDEAQYNEYLDALYPFVAKGILSEGLSYAYKPWEVFVSNARRNASSNSSSKTKASTKVKSIGLHYQGRYRLIADVNAVTDYDKIAEEMTKRQKEYIYPTLVVYGIESDSKAKKIASDLTGYVNSLVNFFAAIEYREKSDGSYHFQIEDDDSWK